MLPTPLRVSVLLVAVVGLIGVPTGGASAHNGHPTTTNIAFTDVPSGTGDTFNGTVTSAPAQCRKNRKVRVYRGTAGGRVLLGSDLTNASGAWSVAAEDPETPPTGESYWARVTQKT